MWSREGLAKTASLYASTPHLFVYQPCEDDEDVDTEPSDSGYAGSMRSGSAGSTSGRGSSTPPEPIYYAPIELAADKKIEDQQAMARLADKYQALGLGDEQCDEEDGLNTQLSESEILRVETFFRGHQTQVFVCRSMANLYLRAAKSLVGLNRFSSQPDVCMRTLQKQEHLVSNWQLKFTGVPVVLLDLGGTKSRTQRRIQLILAERDTGFTLWKDTIDNLSNYEAAQPTFHTMRLSTDHRIIAGLSFDSAPAAQQLSRQIEIFTSDPANIRLSAPKNSSSSSKASGFFKFWTSSSSSSTSPSSSSSQSKNHKNAKKAPTRKSDISQPCCFQHVTSIDPSDNRRYFSLQAYVSK